MRAAFTVEITEAAERDLQEIVEDVWARTGPRTAEKVLDALVETVGTLETFPERGPFPSELAGLGIKDFRQLILQSYRVVYRVIGETVFVMLIADGRRDMQRVLERRLLEH